MTNQRAIKITPKGKQVLKEQAFEKGPVPVEVVTKKPYPTYNAFKDVKPIIGAKEAVVEAARKWFCRGTSEDTQALKDALAVLFKKERDIGLDHRNGIK
jgi:hypothetical protein